MLSPPSHAPLQPAAAGTAIIDRNRRAVFAGVADVVQRYARSEHEQNDWRERAAVWSHGVIMGAPVATIAPDGSHLRLEWPNGLVASIVARLGDCRVGLIVPRSQVPDPGALHNFAPYPDGRPGAENPVRIFRALGDADTLIDFVFSAGRFSDLSVTRSALGGNAVDMGLLSDGLAQETMHLMSALVHHLAQNGLYFGDGPSSNLDPYIFSSTSDDVPRTLNLTRAQVYLVGDGDIPGTRKWMALVPPGQREDFETRLQAMGHLEFLERQKTADRFDIDGLDVHASPGVYHPGLMSSTRFLLDALDRDAGFVADHSQRVLDLGCGTGAIALWIKRKYPHFDVMGSDVDARAVSDASANAQVNRLPVKFAQGDLLAGLPPSPDWSEPFDRVIWNYPFWQARASDRADIDHIAIDENGALLRRLFVQLPKHLRQPTGCFYLTYSSLSSQDLLMQLCADGGLAPTLIESEAPINGYRRQVWRIGFQ